MTIFPQASIPYSDMTAGLMIACDPILPVTTLLLPAGLGKPY